MDRHGAIDRPIPVGWATKTCARCGRSFACGADADSCWCDEVRLTDEQRATLAELGLVGCLCRECLEGLEPRPRGETTAPAMPPTPT